MARKDGMAYYKIDIGLLFRYHEGVTIFTYDSNLIWDITVTACLLLHMITIETAVSYILVYCFDLVLPKSSAKEDQLQCVKANYQAWAQYLQSFSNSS